MPATKIGKIQAPRYRKVNGKIMKSKQSNTDRCLDYINDVNGDKVLKSDLEKINNDELAKSDGTQEYLINYAFNKHKCYDEESKTMLRTAINCSSTDNAKEEFKADEDNYYKVKIESGNSHNINKAFHIINSFKGHDIPAEKVHKIGEEFARRLVGTQFKAVVSTHTNTDNYHNHIVINAYANDGAYKFKDSWNLGLKMQQIANELSLENGIEIITNRLNNDKYELDENKLTFSSIRDHKMALKGSNKQKIMNDIILTAKSSKDFSQYVEQMSKKGYRITKNKKSITYFNEKYGAIRDNRLGYQFTEANIKKYFEDNQQINEFSKIKLIINTKKLNTPKYLGSGIHKTRIPFLLRLVSYLIKLFKEIIVSEPQIIQKNPNFNKIYLKNLKKQVENFEKIYILLKKYEINNFSSLKIKKNQILKDYFTYFNRNKSMIPVIKKYSQLENAINTIKNNQERLKNLNITDKDLELYDIGSANILENRATLDPLTPKTKSRLYKALHNSGYKLKYNFNQITEKQAKDILDFLYTEHTKNIPNTLYTINEYKTLKKANELPVLNYTKKENNFIKLDIDKLNNISNNIIDADTFNSINEYRNAIILLKTYGLYDNNEYENYIEDTIDIVKNNYNSIKEKIKDIKSNINDMNKIESFYNGTYENIYLPLKLLKNEDVIKSDISNLLKENDGYVEQLTALNNTLRDLDISILDDNDLIIAPMDIISTIELIYTVKGDSFNPEDILKLSKDEMKSIIQDFINNYNINELLNNELKLEELSEKQKDKDNTDNDPATEINKKYKDDINQDY